MNWLKIGAKAFRIAELVLSLLIGTVGKTQKGLQDMVVRVAGYNRMKLLIYDKQGRILVSEGFVKAKKIN